MKYEELSKGSFITLRHTQEYELEMDEEGW